jgi:tetratricopeptide (TPR) repeat protein
MFLRLLLAAIGLAIPTLAFAEGELFFVDARPSLTVRSEPSVYGAELAKLPHGVAVRVEHSTGSSTRIGGRNGKWVYIRYSGSNYGYVFGGFLSKHSRKTRSFSYYKKGNTSYRKGKYYQAVSYYSKAWDYAGNDIERMKTLGALAQTAKVEGNVQLSKEYANRILQMDSQNEFALGILGLSRPSSTYSGTSSSYCSNRTLLCLALTWGPDACSTAFSHYAEKEFGTGINDVIASPGCTAAINEVMQQDYSQADLEIAAITGALDELGHAGLNSESGFGQLGGLLSHGLSFAIKFSIFDSCMQKCR